MSDPAAAGAKGASPLPPRLMIDAWTGATASAALHANAVRWALQRRLLERQDFLLPGAPADPRDWRNPAVGWGLVLPEPAGDHGVPASTLATAEDQPAPIRALVAARTVGGVAPPIFRYKPDRPERFTSLLNYATGKPVTIGGGRQGTGSGALPAYLLIHATPRDIPWELQYVLNAHCSVGRLDLGEDDGLAHYVDALVSDDWSGSALDALRTVVWAVDHGPDDITHLMRTAIAAKLAQEYGRDTDLQGKLRWMDGMQAPATGALLVEALHDRGARGGPAVIVTTSHGQTDTALTPAQLRTQLGLPVGHDGATLDADALLADGWQPEGAIWYAHACCSAGSTDLSVFEGLVSDDSAVARVVKGVTGLARQFGAATSPLPRRLLGAERPLRAFVGHVEPTFDWTLRNPTSGQYLTDSLRRAMYDGLYRGEPVGLAFRQWYARIGPLATQFAAARTDFDRGGDPVGDLLFYQLAERDVKSLVLLGDPTVAIPLA